MSGAIYMSSTAIEAYKNKLEEKIQEHKKIYDARIEALRSVRGMDQNDPEIVQYWQLEEGVSSTIAEMRSVLARTKVIEVEDGSRSVLDVRIGSIIKICRTNVDTGISLPDEVWEIAGFDETDLGRRKLAYNAPLASKLLSAEIGETVTDVVVSGGSWDIEIKSAYQSWDDVRSLLSR